MSNVIQIRGGARAHQHGTSIVLNGNRIVRPREAALYLGVSKSTLYRLVESEELCRPRRISTRTTGWLQSELDAYLVSLAPAMPPKTSLT